MRAKAISRRCPDRKEKTQGSAVPLGRRLCRRDFVSRGGPKMRPFTRLLRDSPKPSKPSHGDVESEWIAGLKRVSFPIIKRRKQSLFLSGTRPKQTHW